MAAEQTEYALDQVGLGIDVVEIARIAKILGRTPGFKRIFSQAEQEYCDAKAVPAAHYAARFAAKEAVVKALGTGFAEGVNPRDIEVRRTSKGRPYAVLSGRAQALAEEMGVADLPISLSYTHTEAVACAMAITESSQAAAAKRKDPMEELARQFKDVRSVLDDIG